MHVTTLRRSLLSLAIASGVASLAQAQTDPTELEALTIYSDTYRNTATKTALEPEETPQSISVLDRQALEMRDADSVAASLRYAPGVNTELRGGSVGRLDLFYIRGFEQLYNYYDGLPLLYVDNWNLQAQVDIKAVEQVEVFRGPTSTLYGPMSPGGMINLIPKSPSEERYNRVELSTGSHNLKEASLESAGRFGDSDLSYSLVALARKKDAQAEPAEEERYLVAPSVDWRIGENTLMNFNLYYQDDPEQGIYSVLPATGLFKDNPNGRLDPDAFSGDANWNTADRQVLMAGYKINHNFNDNWTFLHNFRFTDADYFQTNTYGAALAADGRTYSRRAYLTDETAKGYAVDNQLSGRFDTGDLEHNILVGIDYQRTDATIQYEDGAAPDIDLYNPDHYQISDHSLSFDSVYSSDFDQTKTVLGIYLQDQIRLGNWILLGGVRWDSVEATAEGRRYGAQIDTELDQNNVSHRVGALYQFANGWSPYLNYAESFEPVQGSDRNNNEFEPSEGEQIEAGIKYRSADGTHQLDIAAFRIDKTNVPTADPNGSPYHQIQAGKIRSEGFEIEASTRPIDNLLLSASYTLQDMEITRDNSGLEGKTPVWVPEQLFSAWVDYGFTSGALKGLTAGTGVRYIGEMELDAANSGKVPDATLMDLALTYDLRYLSNKLRGAELGLSVNNLFDERYYSCYDANNCWFGAERTVEASVSYTF